ncbi:hypothetical protein SNOG_10717 [Parastagonospora nodorum SN15]|uniref:Uncharacterized protein n=1 Tax=Phaeosphaeria nodorum (strain SN15 / ATCC MYA-4574 / FGSC 10173) TaxID=321614 RepID=Q0UBZ7_PHANO|nr:hypothetical protein SNOG_10717 [Parastagonospora nodorum SN15]EAT82111.1 hypothetical protein SNOG_10717 [Parastagonospora nodorum SN15]
MSTQALVLTNGHTTSNRLAIKLYSDVKRLEIHVFVDTYSTSDPLRKSRDISQGCGGSSRRSFAGNCLNALSVKCALISPYVIMQMDFEICDIVPQQRSSAAVVAQVCKGLRKFRGTSPMLC